VVGGTKGKLLSESVQSIFEEFQTCLSQFMKIKYNIMDVNVADFNEDFNIFRNRIKELDRRLGSVISQSFEDNDSLMSRFKLFDSFDELLNRKLIQEECERKYMVILEQFKVDLKKVQAIFIENKQLLDSNSEAAPIPRNMAPTTGAITWALGLIDRIEYPYKKLSCISEQLSETEEFTDMEKLYKSLKQSLKEYEDQKRSAWESTIESGGNEKLKLFLLKRRDDNMLCVNFDSDLVKLLREIR
jgi:dynein heavy chain